MISRCRSIQSLNELRNCGTVRFRRRIILQDNAKVIYAFGWPAGCALPKFDRRPGRYRRRGSRRQIACDLMDLRGRETVLFALLAAAGENCEKKANSQKREIS